MPRFKIGQGQPKVSFQRTEARSIEQTAKPMGIVGTAPIPAHMRPVNPGFASMKAGLVADLTSLRQKAASIRTEMRSIEQDVNATKADVERLQVLAKELEDARAAARGAVKAARAERKAEMAEAKSIVDEHFAALEQAVGPEGASVLKRKRKTLLNRLARAAIAQGDPTPNGKPRRRKQKTVDSVLDQIQRMLLEHANEGGEDTIKTQIDGLRGKLSERQDAMAGRQKKMVAERKAAMGCEDKKDCLSADIEKQTKKISDAQKRLEALKPKLTALESRIAQVQKSIDMIEMMTELIETQEEVAQAEHEHEMIQHDRQIRDEKLRDLENHKEQLQATARQARMAAEEAGYTAESTDLDGDIAVARDILKRYADDIPQLEGAFALLTSLLNQDASADRSALSIRAQQARD